jgi:hypothetical protein
MHHSIATAPGTAAAVHVNPLLHEVCQHIEKRENEQVAKILKTLTCFPNPLLSLPIAILDKLKLKGFSLVTGYLGHVSCPSLDVGNSAFGSCMHVAVRCRNVVALKMLLERGGSPDICDPQNCKPLDLALAKKESDAVALLTDHGAFTKPLPHSSMTSLVAAAPSIPNPDKTRLWAERVSQEQTYETSLSAFASPLDSLFLNELGAEAYGASVAKVIINGRRYVLVAETHYEVKFALLKAALINAINGSATHALFVEGVTHIPEDEEAAFNSSIKNGTFKGRLYGIDDLTLINLQTYFSGRALESSGGLKKAQIKRLEFLKSNHESMGDREIWEKFKRVNRDPSLDEMIATIDSVLTHLRKIKDHLAKEQLLMLAVRSPKLSKSEQWKRLYEGLMLCLLQESQIPAEVRKLTLAVLQGDQSLHREFFTRTMEARDPVMIQNIKETLAKLPPATEAVVIVGFLHMPRIVAGLYET